MRRHSLWIACAPVAALLIAAACSDRAQPVEEPPAASSSASALELAVGGPAPDFSLPGSDGRVHRLSDYRGRQAVVLAWFSKAFTEG